MYPSKGHPSFGIFVKKFEEAIEGENFSIAQRAVIAGQGRDLFTKSYKYAKFYAEIVFKILKNNYDLIYIHYISNSAPVLIFLTKFIKKPLVINFHGGDLLPENGLERYTESLSRILVKRADLIVVPSGYFKKSVLDKYSLHENKVYVYPSGGIDLNLFKPLNKDQIRKEFQLNDCWTIGYVSRIAKGKGWDVFLKALSLFGRKHPSLKFKAVVAGIGEMVPDFNKLLESLNIKDKVLYLGEKKQKDLPEIYNLLDVFVFPTSLAESLGLVGLEAMACGVPVIAAEQPGIKEYLKPGINGLFCESKNENDLCQRLEDFYELSVEEKNRLQRNALLTAGEFETKKVTRDLGQRLKGLFRNENSN